MSSFLNSLASFPMYDSTHFLFPTISLLPTQSPTLPMVGLFMPRSLSNTQLINKPTGHLLVLTLLDLLKVVDIVIHSFFKLSLLLVAVATLTFHFLSWSSWNTSLTLNNDVHLYCLQPSPLILPEHPHPQL